GGGGGGPPPGGGGGGGGGLTWCETCLPVNVSTSVLPVKAADIRVNAPRLAPIANTRLPATAAIRTATPCPRAAAVVFELPPSQTSTSACPSEILVSRETRLRVLSGPES